MKRGTTVWDARAGETARSAAFADLAVNQSVSAWATGPVAESYPRQGTAAAILIHAD